MTQLLLDVDLIRPNPYQVRLEEDEAHIAGIAESIRAVGLLQVPLARPAGDASPHSPRGGVELAFGHSRLAAWKRARPGEPFPLEVRELTDRQMSDLAAEENSRRKNLSAIETAAAIRRRMADFRLTQLEAGRPFGYSSQGSVANLLRLLELPDDVQPLVARQELPERAARRLLPLMRWRPAEVGRIASRAVKDEDPAGRVEAEIWSVLRNKGQGLNDYQRPWPMDWPKTPLAVPDFNQAKGEPAEVPACRGCEFHVRANGSDFCLRPACHAVKSKLYARGQAEAAAAKLKIPLAQPGEKVTVIFDGMGDYRAQQQAEKLVKSKHPALRLVAIPDDRRSGYGLRDVTGTKYAFLATVDKAATDKIAGSTAAAKAVVAEKPKHESPAQKEMRLNAERELAEERWLERSAFNRSKADTLWLLGHVADLVAERTVGAGGLLAFAAHEAHREMRYYLYQDDLKRARGERREQAGIKEDDYTYTRDGVKDYAKPTTPALDQARRAYIAYIVLASAVGHGNAADIFGSFGKNAKTCEKIASKTFGVALPAGWDEPPIHHTAYNCWTCGLFAGNPAGLTKAERGDGWRAFWRRGELVLEEAGRGTELAGCFCPAHAPDGEQRLRARPLVEVFLEQAETKPKANGKPTKAQAAAAAAGHVRGHTKPNGKPGKAKPAAPITAGASTGKLSRRARQQVTP